MKEPSIAHYYFYALLKREAQGSMLIRYECVKRKIDHFIAMPYCYKLIFLKEMESFKMIKKVNLRVYKLEYVKCDKELYDSHGERILWN